MYVTRKIAMKLAPIKRVGMCPMILNMYVERYSFKFFLNDILSGVKIFLFLFPIVFSLAFFQGASPIQGTISCTIATIVSLFIGGSKYHIMSISLPVCVIAFEILSKYQYKGLLYTSIFVLAILALFGILKLSEVLKHISYAFISALSVYVVFAIVINQVQYLLGVQTIQSSQGILENFSLLSENLTNVTGSGLMIGTLFFAPLFLLKSFLKGYWGFFAYLVLGGGAAYLFSTGILPDVFSIKILGQEISIQSVDNILNVSTTIPSQIFLSNTLNYAFILAIIIACESCFCTNVSSSITGDRRVQGNIELVSSGLANFASIACGGLFVSPNVNFSMKNIKEKSKTIVPLVVIIALCFGFIKYNDYIMRFMPVQCIASILIMYAFSELLNKKVGQYFNFKVNDSYIFWITLLLAIYFGFIPATIVGFSLSCVFFAKRMVNIKDATVHTVVNHDRTAIEFMMNKNGFADSLEIPPQVIDRIEVVQITNVLFLNIAQIVEEALNAQGRFPNVLIVYFNNVPYMDTEAFENLKILVKKVKARGAIVIVSGTNGKLLDILQQRAQKEASKDVFGYIIPNFSEAIKQSVKNLKV